MLNFGHTIGHAIEAASDYRLSHGQSVSIGMVAETWLAESLGLCIGGVLARLVPLLDRFGLPSVTRGLDEERVWEFLAQDKKRVSGTIRLALPTEPGAGDLYPLQDSHVQAAVRYALGDA
jgi:3-dehydroquinate synthetase